MRDFYLMSNRKNRLHGQKASRGVITFGSRKVLRIVAMMLGVICCGGGSSALAMGGENMDTLLGMSLDELVELKVSLATGTPKSIRQAPAIASVITAEDIERMGATTLQEALATVPGLHISQSNLQGIPIYSLRGIHTSTSPQMLFQINGLPIKYTYSGMIPSRLRIPVSTISRVEVVRGPGSAVHGADAFSGIINVVTKDGKEINGTEGGLRYGSFSSRNGWALSGGERDGWEYMTSVDYFKTEGDGDRIIDSDLQTGLDASLNIPFGLPAATLTPAAVNSALENVDLRLSLAKENWRLRLWGSFSDNGFGVGLTPALDTYARAERQIYQGDLVYTNDDLVDNWQLSSRLSYLYNKSEALARMFPPGALLPIGSDGNIGSANTAGLVLFSDGVFGQPIIEEEQTSLDLTALYEGLADHLLRFGAGGRYITDETDNYKNFGPGVIDTTTLLAAPAVNVIDGTMTHLTSDSPYIFMNDKERTLWYGSLQDEWSFADKWELTLGLRYDNYSDFGDTVNPRAAVVWEATETLTTKLLYGSAFRPPAFAEFYLINNPSGLGNANLKPETIDTYELVFDYQPRSNLHWVFNLFVYEAKDLIEFVPDPTPASTVTADNARNQQGRGFELEMDWLATHTLRLRGNVAYQRSKDKDSGALVANATTWQTYLNGHWQFMPDWSLDSQYFWISDRRRAEADTRPKIKDNDWLNLTLRRKNIAKHWELALSAHNVFDEDIREPVLAASIANDLPLDGRSLWAEVRWSF